MSTTTTDYNQQAIDFLASTGATISVKYNRTGMYFNGDKDERDIYDIIIERKGRKFSFEFGNSVLHSGKFICIYGAKTLRFNERPGCSHPLRMKHYVQDREIKTNPDFEIPTAYSVLACLTKYDIGSFDDFCSEFGYEFSNSKEYKQVEKTYNAVVNEYDNLQKLFTEDEMEELREIK